jgi:hypothetical protein
MNTVIDEGIIGKKLYPIVEKALQKNDSKFKANIKKYFQDRHEQLFAIAPYDRIFFNQVDIDNLYKSLEMNEQEVLAILKQVYFWDKPYNPQCAKEPYVETLMCTIRYYLKKNDKKSAYLACTYMAFTGKFYASVHGAAFPTVAPIKYKSVMDYVVNNMLSDKFDLKKYGTVFGAIEAMCKTFIDTYEKQIKASNILDDDFGKLIQQLRTREMSFMMNIQSLYMEAYENKYYLNYESESEYQDDFKLPGNDSATALKITEQTMNYLTSTYVSLDICNKCKDSNVKALEIKDIMESILGDKNNLSQVRRLVNIMICNFMANNPGKKVGSIEFVAFTTKPKPNTKSAVEIEQKQIITRWLDENSPNYRRRKSREATANSYIKSVTMYFTLVINKIAK